MVCDIDHGVDRWWEARGSSPSVATKYGVSDNSIRKWKKFYEIYDK